MPSNPFHEPTQASALPRYHQGRRLMGGRYTLVRRLGRGGMGEVWLAQDNELTGQRALKFAPQELVADAKSAAMLKHEVIAGISLAHPHVVRVYDFAQDHDEDESAVVMEAVEGHSLADLQAMRITERGHGCFDPEELLPWLRQACAALEYAHGEGRVHRDLKPQNLLIEKATSRLKIADFGISRRIGESMSRLSSRDSSATRPYVSPQQLDGRRASAADDIYGLGATIYDLLTGVPPFEGGDLETQIHFKTPSSIRQRRHDLGVDDMQPVPEAWEALVSECLAKEPEDRPASAPALLALLEQAAQSSPGVKQSRPAAQAVEVPAGPESFPMAEMVWPPASSQAARPAQSARPPLRPITPIPPLQDLEVGGGWSSPRRPAGNLRRRRSSAVGWLLLMIVGLTVLGGLGYGAWRFKSRTSPYTPRELPKIAQTDEEPQAPSDETRREEALQEQLRRQREMEKAAKEKLEKTVKVFQSKKATAADDAAPAPVPPPKMVEDTSRPAASMPALPPPLAEHPLIEPSAPPVVSPVSPRSPRVERATPVTDDPAADLGRQELPQPPLPLPPVAPVTPPRAVPVEEPGAPEMPAPGRG